MRLLPPLLVGLHEVRLPLADASSVALVQALLAIEPDRYETPLSGAIANDPPLAIFCLCRGGCAFSASSTIADLARWLRENACEVFRECAAVSARSVEPVLAELHKASLSAALWSIPHLEGSHAQPRYLTGLVSNAAEWIAAAAGSPPETPIELPASIAQRRWEKAAPDNQATCEEIVRLVEASHQEWLTPHAWAPEALDGLLQKLDRLSMLEQSFHARLEEEKLASLAEFAAGAGHEINNPLAVISGRAQLLLREERDPERRRDLALINSQALRVHEMIADLMLFARPPKPQPKTVNLRQLLEKVVDEYRDESAEQGIELNMESPEISLPADPTQLAVALRAVVANSLEAIGRKGQVAISALMAGTMVQIVVRDTGPGIPSEVRRHLFDPFFSGRSAGRGLGTGLSKCWQIVRQHGGQIEVESTPNQGATFIISLPCP